MSNFKLFFSGCKEGFKDFGRLITNIVNYTLLSFTYFVAVGLTSITAKIFKKHFLDIKKNKKIKSYWIDLNLKKKEIEEYYNQF